MAETKIYDPWKDMVVVRIFKTSSQDEDFQFVNINGKTFQIQKNVNVEVPRPVAAILQQRDEAIQVTEKAENAKQAVFDEQNKK